MQAAESTDDKDSAFQLAMNAEGKMIQCVETDSKMSEQALNTLKPLMLRSFPLASSLTLTHKSWPPLLPLLTPSFPPMRSGDG